MARRHMICFTATTHLFSLRIHNAHALCPRPQPLRYFNSSPRATLSAVSNPNAPPRSSKPVKNASTEIDMSKYISIGLGVVVLKRGIGGVIRTKRSSIVYGDSVASVIGEPAAGDAVAVLDGAGLPVGYGFYNDASLLRVRILRRSIPDTIDIERDVLAHVNRAFNLRSTIGLPNRETSAYRVVNGISDGLSGLVVDAYGSILVASASALWVERYREKIIRALRNAAPHITEVVWRSSIDRLQQDGYERPPHEADKASTSDSVTEEGEDIQVVENGVQFLLPSRILRRGQKTGHFSDQRDARAHLRNIVEARGGNTTLLDLYSYSGGFGINAALAGATVTCVDSSESALSLARTNATLNGVADRMQFMKSDVSKALSSITDMYDVVVCDPPKLAPNAKALPRASRKYRGLNAACLRRVRNGGLLLTCSCSAAVAREKGLFVELIRQAASDAGVDLKLLTRFGSAMDHPIALDAPDGDYLTSCLFVCYKYGAK